MGWPRDVCAAAGLPTMYCVLELFLGSTVELRGARGVVSVRRCCFVCVCVSTMQQRC